MLARIFRFRRPKRLRTRPATGRDRRLLVGIGTCNLHRREPFWSSTLLPVGRAPADRIAAFAKLLEACTRQFKSACIHFVQRLHRLNKIVVVLATTSRRKSEQYVPSGINFIEYRLSRRMKLLGCIGF